MAATHTDDVTCNHSIRVVAPTSQLSKRPVCADILEIHISKQTITTYNKNYFSDHFITIYHV